MLIGAKTAEVQLLQQSVDNSEVRIVAMDDAAEALVKMEELRPNLILIGSIIPRDHAHWVLIRMMASSTLRGIAVVLIVHEVSRTWMLEMIKLGLRAYIKLPREREDFRRRLAQHLPAGIFPELTQDKLRIPRESIGERIRQRMAKKQLEKAVTKAGMQSGSDLKKQIPLLEQKYVEDFGLRVRISSRKISLFEKIDEYMLRFGRGNSHIIGIFMVLLVEGKIRVDIRDKSERLSLVKMADRRSGKEAILLIDEYLSQPKPSSSELDTRTQIITF